MIENEREYPDVLVDDSYETVIEVSDYVNLDDDVHPYGNYKRDKFIKRRPPAVSELCGKQPVVWLDERNSKTGFAGKDHAFIYDTEAIERIAIQNVLPAKGAGYSELKLELKNKSLSRSVFMATCRAFDDDAEK